MNARMLSYAMATVFCVVALPAMAHDPKEHAKEAAAAKAGPDCEKMKTMDMSNMSKNDPTMLAMQSKCAKHMQPAETGSKAGSHDDDHGEGHEKHADDHAADAGAQDEHGDH